jgi:3-hydroxyisobutyrate dehydrogenase
MAKNLRSKIPESDTMVIHDVNQTALDKFKSEMGNVEIAKNVREVAEKTVCIPSQRLTCTLSR